MPSDADLNLEIESARTPRAAVILRARPEEGRNRSTRSRFVVSILLCLFPSLISAAELSPVESGKRALSSTAPPWYDGETDALKPLEIAAESEAERAKSTEQPKTPEWSFDWSWWPTFPYFGELLRYLGWALLVAILAFLVYALVRAFMNADPMVTGGVTGKSENVDPRADKERIENLPVPLKARRGNFLDLARQFYEEGNFRDAIVYLFSHRLLQLDRSGRIRLTKGKTNRQYLHEIKSSRDLQKILGRTIVSFEDVFFGRHDLSREKFEACWRQNDQFEQLVQQVTT